MVKRLARMASGLVIAGVMAACAPTPSFPLLTPIQIAHDYGFSETPMGADRWEVVFLLPQQQAYGFRFDNRPAESQAKGAAFDFALWRASQIAASQGFPGFHLEDRKADIDQEHRGGYWDGPPGVYGPPFHRHWVGGAYWDDYYEPPKTLLQAQVSIIVTLVKEPKPGDYLVADTLARLRAAYPDAETAPAAMLVHS